MSTSAKPVIDLIIPGLLNLPVHELDTAELVERTPALHKFLQYADRVPSDLADMDEVLIQRLGLKQSALPYAYAITEHNDGQHLVFKLVHLKTDINNAIVYPVASDDEKILRIINDLKDYFKDDCDIERLPDDQWLMTLKSCVPITELPHYLSALGKKVTHYLQQAKTNLEWFKLFNEMQMFLFQHEVNQQRQQQGLPPINSLWCYGADHYYGEKISNTRWFSDDYDMQKIGELYAGKSDAIRNIQSISPDSNAIIVDLSILKLLKGQNHMDIRQILQAIEKNCFKVLMKFNGHQRIIHTGGRFNFHYGTLSRFKLWKKSIDLHSVILQSQQQ